MTTTQSPPPPLTTTCVLCNSEGVAPFESEFGSLYRCGHCGFIFAAPGAEGGSPADYEETFAGETPHPTYQKVNGQYVVRNARKLGQLLDRLKRYRKTGRILDVGCSAAFFLKLAAERGWQCRGVDISEFGVRFSREELGIDVHLGTLEDAAFPDGHFDVVFSSHVLEHIADPLELLAEMRRVLRPGGAIVTVIPTQFAAPSYRFCRKLFGDSPPRHVSYYSRSNFSRLLEKAGFDVVEATCNVELDRIRQLFRSRRTWSISGDEKNATSNRNDEAPSAAGNSTDYGPVISSIKAVVNPVATMLGIGDELLAIAVKPGG